MYRSNIHGRASRVSRRVFKLSNKTDVIKAHMKAAFITGVSG